MVSQILFRLHHKYETCLLYCKISLQIDPFSYFVFYGLVQISQILWIFLFISKCVGKRYCEKVFEQILEVKMLLQYTDVIVRILDVYQINLFYNIYEHSKHFFT